jgi:hypothetical protein
MSLEEAYDESQIKQSIIIAIVMDKVVSAPES